MPSGYGEVSTGNTPCPFVCRGQPMLIPQTPSVGCRSPPLLKFGHSCFRRMEVCVMAEKKALLHSCWMHFWWRFQRNLYHLSPVEAPGAVSGGTRPGLRRVFPTTPWIQENLREKSCFPIRKRPRWRKQPLPRSCRGSCAVASLCFQAGARAAPRPLF